RLYFFTSLPLRFSPFPSFHYPHITPYTFFYILFFFNATAPTDLSTLSLHDALPIFPPPLWPGETAPWPAPPPTVIVWTSWGTISPSRLASAAIRSGDDNCAT